MHTYYNKWGWLWFNKMMIDDVDGSVPVSADPVECGLVRQVVPLVISTQPAKCHGSQSQIVDWTTAYELPHLVVSQQLRTRATEK